jgi:dTDP-4-amino-4,6-dideoxygalactose transaminase
MNVPFTGLREQYDALRAELQAALLEPLQTMDVSLGASVRAFEAEFAAFCGTRYAVGVGSGTDALYLALRACGVSRGDEVITAAHGRFSTAEAIVLLGAVPVLVDVEPATYTLDPSKIDAAVSGATRAIVPVHLNGQTADMGKIMEVAQRHALAVVEDAREAHGAEACGQRAGSFGDAAAFSFSSSKNLGAFGDAGAVTTNSRAVADGVRLLRDHGIGEDGAHQEMGISSRLDDIQAAVLRVKLRYLGAWNERRRGHARSYERLLKGTAIETPAIRPGTKPVFHRYVVKVPDADLARRALADRGVAVGERMPLALHQQCGALEIGRTAGGLRATDEVAGRLISLPMYPELELQQLAYVAACLREHLAASRGAVRV